MLCCYSFQKLQHVHIRAKLWSCLRGEDDRKGKLRNAKHAGWLFSGLNTCWILAQNTSSRYVANPSLIHSSVQSRAPMAKPNQEWAISWHNLVPHRILLPANTLWDRKMICGLENTQRHWHENKLDYLQQSFAVKSFWGTIKSWIWCHTDKS